MLIQNAPSARRFFGSHFYPGVAEYRPEGEEPFRVFLNEEALRAMDPSFEGKPVYVMHIDDEDIPATIDEARKEADGWVVRSFYNAADGEHWCEFMLMTQRAINAIEHKGYALSNAYRATNSVNAEGVWNGVDYVKEVKNGEYRHLALVPNPRYKSRVMTPEEFKIYNAEKLSELQNANDEGGQKLIPKLNFFKRSKVDKLENSGDLEGLEVQLPKSKRTVSILELVNSVDAEPGKPIMANMAHHLQYGENTMSLNDFLGEHKKMSEAYNALKAQCENADDKDKDDKENGDDDFGTATAPTPTTSTNADDDEDEEEKKKKKAEEKENALEEKRVKDAALAEKKKKDKEKADELRNARETAEGVGSAVQIDLSVDQKARGDQRYGSDA